MNLGNSYKALLTQIKHLVITCGLTLAMLAMVPWASLATDQKEIGNLLQTADSTSASDNVQVKSAWSVERARPGETVALAVVIDI